MKKGITWATVILLFVLIISMSANLIAGGHWDCPGECPGSCDCDGWMCDTIEECCGYCEDEEHNIICGCCLFCTFEM